MYTDTNINATPEPSKLLEERRLQAVADAAYEKEKKTATVPQLFFDAELALYNAELKALNAELKALNLADAAGIMPQASLKDALNHRTARQPAQLNMWILGQHAVQQAQEDMWFLAPLPHGVREALLELPLPRCRAEGPVGE